MTKLFLALCLVLLSVSSNAQIEIKQTGSIKGIITSGDNKSVVSATVLLNGTKRATFTNNEGAFSIEKVMPGDYQLGVSNVGYQPLEKNVTIVVGSCYKCPGLCGWMSKPSSPIALMAAELANPISKMLNSIITRPLSNSSNPFAMPALFYRKVYENFFPGNGKMSF